VEMFRFVTFDASVFLHELFLLLLLLDCSLRGLACAIKLGFLDEWNFRSALLALVVTILVCVLLLLLLILLL